ncbi:MAG: hypothetical protein EKK39_14825 [Sphingobacteriales bacterium]|nr:MAG: hypothetical protein EKK39_14825 [Sphingobacteriales bacterium]
MRIIRYDLIGAYKAGVKIHPQRDVERLGMKVICYEGIPIADCIMMKVDDVPKNIPFYIELVAFQCSTCRYYHHDYYLYSFICNLSKKKIHGDEVAFNGTAEFCEI